MVHEQQQLALGHVSYPSEGPFFHELWSLQEIDLLVQFLGAETHEAGMLSPFSLGSPGFPFAHLTNDLQPTTGLSWAPKLRIWSQLHTAKRSYVLETCMREGKKKKKKKKKSQVLPTSSIQTGFRKNKRGKKKILCKEPVFKEHDLCGVRTARSGLLSEETPKPGTRGHRFALSQTPQPALLWWPPSRFQSISPGQAVPKGCCQCSRTEPWKLVLSVPRKAAAVGLAAGGHLQGLAGRQGASSSSIPRGSGSGVVIHCSFQQLFIILISILPSTTPYTVWSEAHSHFLEASRPQNAELSSQIVSILNGSQDSYSNLEPTHENKRG